MLKIRNADGKLVYVLRDQDESPVQITDEEETELEKRGIKLNGLSQDDLEVLLGKIRGQ